MNDRSQDPDALLAQASAFVYTLFKEKLPDTIRYHSFQHTLDVVREAERLARKAGLDETDVLLVSLAAWFHDTGFTETYEEHEEAGARIATAFLSEQGMAPDAVEEVVGLIYSTHAGREPRDLREEVLYDADMAHLGKKKKFFAAAERLRREWEVHRDLHYTDLEWAELQMRFVSSFRYRTPYARQRYEPVRRRNVERLQRQLAALLDPDRQPAGGEERRAAPTRGIETLFRVNYRNHINLSAIADSKANIMISVNAILMSIIVSFLSTRLQAESWMMIPATAMLITSLVTIIFAILSTRPKVTSEVYTLDDIRRNRANILFFGNFVNLDLPAFGRGMHEIMADWDRLYDSMIHDLYSLGRVLSKKYRLLWLSYTAFMVGLILTVVLFLIFYAVSTAAPGPQVAPLR